MSKVGPDTTYGFVPEMPWTDITTAVETDAVIDPLIEKDADGSEPEFI